MGLFSRFRRPPAEERSTLADPPQWLVEALTLGTSSWSGKPVTIASAFQLSTVFAAINLLASSAAVCPLRVFRGEGRDRVPAPDTPQWRLLHDDPNEEMPADLWTETVMGHLQAWGNTYLEKERANDVVVGLWPIAPSRVSVDRTPTGAKVFHVDAEPRSFTSRDILHIPGFGYDGRKGLSPIELGRQTIGTILSREEFEAKFYANGAAPGGFLEHPGRLSDAAKTSLRQQWDSVHAGTENAGRTAILEEGMSWRAAGLPLTDQQFIENANFSVSQIARVFNVPPEMIGGVRQGGLTYSTVEGQALHFVKFSLTRWLVRIEKALRKDRDLFPTGELTPRFVVEGMLRGDSSARAAYYEKMYALKAMSREEIREIENLGPVVEGDTFGEQPGTAPAGPDEGSSSEEDGSSNGKPPVPVQFGEPAE